MEDWRPAAWLYVLLLVIVHGVRSALSEDVLYFANQKGASILRMPLVGGNHTTIPVNRLLNPIALAYDGRSRTLFYTERSGTGPNLPKYVGAYRESSGPVGLPHELARISIPDGLAVDSISGLVYYTDAGNSIIGVLDPNLQHTTTIIREGIKSPRGITLDPLEGLMYWTDWGSGVKHIGRAFMDGSRRSVIVNTGLGWPNDITLDTTGPVKYLYWCDARFDVIKRAGTDGSDVRTIFQQSGHFFGIAVDETYIYYTDWQKPAVQRITKNRAMSATDLGMVHPNNSVKFHGLTINKASLQLTGSNACSGTGHGGCAHLCLPSGPNTRVCRCHNGFVIKPDGAGCEKLPLRNALLVSDEAKKGIFALDLDKDVFYRLPLLGHHTPRGIAYDDRIDQFFWVDAGKKIVLTNCLHGACLKKLTTYSGSGVVPVGIALDKDNQRVYVVDSGTPMIISMSYVGNQEKTLITTNLSTPLSIALDTQDGFMYWSDSGGSPRIERARLSDGSDRDVFVSVETGAPKGLALDLFGRRLFWANSAQNRIEMISLSGTGRQTIYHKYPEAITYLTFGNGKLYFSISGSKNIRSINLQTNDQETYGDDHFLMVSGLALVSNGMNHFSCLI